MKPEIIAAEYFFRYINLVKEENINKALKKNTKQFLKLLNNIPKKKIGYAYAEGKWTIKQLLQQEQFSQTRASNNGLQGTDHEERMSRLNMMGLCLPSKKIRITTFAQINFF